MFRNTISCRLASVGLALLAVLWAACSAPGGDVAEDQSTPQAESNTIVGTVELGPGDWVKRGCDGYNNCDANHDRPGFHLCIGEGGYDDQRAGAQVRVLDQDNTVLAIGELGPGAVAPDSSIRSDVCTFQFAVEGVPNTASFYTVSIAGRDGPTYSLEDLRERDWKVSLTLG